MENQNRSNKEWNRFYFEFLRTCFLWVSCIQRPLADYSLYKTFGIDGTGVNQIGIIRMRMHHWLLLRAN
jgi:hypothetical protein